jgi:hypothetical protein
MVLNHIRIQLICPAHSVNMPAFLALPEPHALENHTGKRQCIRCLHALEGKVPRQVKSHAVIAKVGHVCR